MKNHDNTKYSEIKDDTVRISTRVYNYEQQNLQSSVNAIINASMFFQVHKYYSNGLLRLYVYHHAHFLIGTFSSNYRNAYKNPLEELELVYHSSLNDLAAAKKMIRLLVGFSKIDIPLTSEYKQFIEL